MPVASDDQYLEGGDLVQARATTIVVLICGAALALVGCGARTAATPAGAVPAVPSSAAPDEGTCPRRASWDPGPPVSWAYVVRWSQRSYLGSGRVVPAGRRGALLGRVRCDVSTAAFPVQHRLRAGDATFAAGTRLYEAVGVPLTRALLVQRGARYELFSAVASAD